MEADAQYALHDAAAGAPRWAAHVRLTPELLRRLARGADAQISIRLNASGAASLGRSRKTSVLKVTAPRSDASGSDDSDSEEEGDALSSEQYELLSFPEDPRVNHVCAFRRVDGAAGYAVHRAGAVHQKLIVQRLLDTTEKDRMKDRHATLVKASKARASKLIDAVEGPPGAARKRRRLTAQLPVRPVTRAGAKQSASLVQAATTMRLPSALEPEEAQRTRERIEAGFEQPAPESSVPDAALASDASTEVIVSTDCGEDAEATEAALPVVAPAKTTLASATAPAKRQRKRAAKDMPSSRTDVRAMAAVSDAMSADSKESSAASDLKAARVATSKLPSKKRARKETPQAGGIDEYLAAVPASNDNGKTRKEGSAEADAAPTEAEAIATPEPSTSAASGAGEKPKSVASRPTATVKRPRQRAVAMPDLSFFPPAVAEICERVARHKSRSAILDEADYDAFVTQHDGLRRDWETLDKAFSIELIRSEGLHLQLELASSLEQRVSLNDRLQAAAGKKEGLQFVQSTMAAIHKLLAGIQASVLRFDRK